MTYRLKILNADEEITHDKLTSVCKEFGARVFVKNRVADTLKIDNSGLSNAQYSFALKSHFDFVVTDKEYLPLFSVEYDGAYHKYNAKQIERDQLKDSICSHFEYPVLRIKSRYINREYRGIDLLTYFIEVWFLQEAFFEAQESGQISPYEIFEPAFINSSPERKNLYPYWLTLSIQLKIKELYKKHKVIQEVPSFFVGVDQENNFHCISWLYVNENQVVCEKTAMRAQNYPISESDVLSMLIMFDLYDSLRKYFQAGDDKSVISNWELVNRLKEFKKAYGVRSCFSCSPNVDNKFSFKMDLDDFEVK